MIEIPDECSRCPEIRTFLLRKAVLDSRMDEQKLMAEIVMEDPSNRQNENWSNINDDIPQEGANDELRERRAAVGRSMDQIDREIESETKQIKSFIDLCGAGVVELHYVHNEEVMEVKICGSNRAVAIGTTWAYILPRE